MSAIREQVKEAYSKSPAWAYKVDHMDDGQVFAIFNRLKQKGRIK